MAIVAVPSRCENVLDVLAHRDGPSQTTMKQQIFSKINQLRICVTHPRYPTTASGGYSILYKTIPELKETVGSDGKGVCMYICLKLIRSN